MVGEGGHDDADLIAKYAVNTRSVKLRVVLIAILTALALASCFAYGGFRWRHVAAVSIMIPASLLVLLWGICARWVFGYEYRVTSEGIAAIQYGREKKFFHWSEVKAVRLGVVIAGDGRRMHSGGLGFRDLIDATRAIRKEWKDRCADADRST